MMFNICDFIGETTLANEWAEALFDHDFESLVRHAEECTSKENVRNYLSEVLHFLQSISISDFATRAEQDVLVLEDICSGFYNNKNNKEYPSDYEYLAHRVLAFINFPYHDTQLCITLAVLYLSANFRIWACKKCIQEFMDKSQESYGLPVDITLLIQDNRHLAIYKMQQWLKVHYAEPTLSKIYLRAFDLKILSYYTRKFGEKTAYETMREYIKEHDTL